MPSVTPVKDAMTRLLIITPVWSRRPIAPLLTIACRSMLHSVLRGTCRPSPRSRLSPRSWWEIRPRKVNQPAPWKNHTRAGYPASRRRRHSLAITGDRHCVAAIRSLGKLPKKTVRNLVMRAMVGSGNLAPQPQPLGHRSIRGFRPETEL